MLLRRDQREPHSIVRDLRDSRGGFRRAASSAEPTNCRRMSQRAQSLQVPMYGQILGNGRALGLRGCMGACRGHLRSPPRPCTVRRLTRLAFYCICICTQHGLIVHFDSRYGIRGVTQYDLTIDQCRVAGDYRGFYQQIHYQSNPSRSARCERLSRTDAL